MIQAVGGLNVAFILKYADNILKGFAAAFSTVASCVLEMAIMHFRPTATFLLGGALINVAAYCYNTPGRPGSSKLPMRSNHVSSVYHHTVIDLEHFDLRGRGAGDRPPRAVAPNFRDRRGDGDGRLVRDGVRALERRARAAR